MKVLLASLSLLMITPIVTSKFNFNQSKILTNTQSHSSEKGLKNLRPLSNMFKHHKKQKKPRQQKTQPKQPGDIIYTTQLDLSFVKQNSFSAKLPLSDGKYKIIINLFDDESQPVRNVKNLGFESIYNGIPIALTETKGLYEGYFNMIPVVGRDFKAFKPKTLHVNALNQQPSPTYTSIDIKIVPVCTTLLADEQYYNLIRNGEFDIGPLQQKLSCLPYWQVQGNLQLEYGGKYYQDYFVKQKVLVMGEGARIRQDFGPLNIQPKQVNGATHTNILTLTIQYLFPPQSPAGTHTKILINSTPAATLSPSANPNPQQLILRLNGQKQGTPLILPTDKERTLELVAVGGTVVIAGVHVGVRLREWDFGGGVRGEGQVCYGVG